MAFSVRRSIAVAGTVLCAVATAVSPAHAAPSQGWRISQLLDPQKVSNLLAITATGPKDAWTFGDGPNYRPVALHWDGTKWRAAVFPGADARPEHVDSTSPTNVWASGTVCADSVMSAYVSRWNGRKWTTINFKHLPFCGSSVVTTGPKDGWLFGGQTSNDHSAARALHFNGAKWRTVTLGNVGSVLTASAVSPRDVWAFTYRNDKKALAIHWDGRSWRSVPLPKLPLAKDGSLYPIKVRAVSSKDVWATADVLGNHPFPVLLHWNGKIWQRVHVPGNDALYQLASDGGGGVWIIGTPANAAQNAYSFLHYSHGNWTQQPFPTSGLPGVIPNSVVLDAFDITAIPGTRSVWATADAFYSDKNNANRSNTLIYKYGP